MTITIMDRMTRKVRIDELKEHSPRKEVVNFRGRQETCPVIRVPIELLIYRMRNGRTTVAQIEYICNNNRPSTFFVMGEDDQTAQAVQHSLLLRMAKNSSRNIYRELEYIRKQTESLIITEHGVVVNGNRRLAAMRELVYQDSKSFSSFNSVDVIVLPEGATEFDLDEIEVEEQLTPETKQAYGWIERLLKIRMHSNQGSIPRSKIIDMYRLSSEKELNKQLQLLALIDNYLEEYLGASGEYHRVTNSEQIFNELQKAREGKTPEIAEYSLLVAYPVIKESRNLETRAYDYKAAFGKHVTKIVDFLASQQDIELSDADVDKVKLPESLESSDDPFSGFTYVGSSMDSVRLERVRTILGDSDKSEEAAKHIKDAFVTIDQQEKQGEESLEAVRNIEKAMNLLLAVNLGGSDYNTYPRMKQYLKTISRQVQRLQNEVDSQLGSNPTEF